MALKDNENIWLWVLSVFCEQNIFYVKECQNSKMCLHVHGGVHAHSYVKEKLWNLLDIFLPVLNE